MRKDLDEALCKEFPTLYIHRHGNTQYTAMCWGFECDDGWYSLIREASRKIVEVCPNAIMTQVKEKYGNLRLYHIGNDESLDVEDWACKESKTICEVCGAPGKIVSTSGDRYGWLKTLCSKHTEELNHKEIVEDEDDAHKGE